MYFYRCSNVNFNDSISSNSYAKGFSLIEIMIVVLIIGISASMAVLYIENSDDRLKSEVKRFFGMAQLARDDAIVKGQSIAITINTIDDIAQYHFSQLEDGKWIPFDDKPYRLIKFSHDIKMRSILSNSVLKSNVKNSGDILEQKGLIYFLPTGESSEFQIWLSNNNTGYVFSSTILGELSLKRSEKP